MFSFVLKVIGIIRKRIFITQTNFRADEQEFLCCEQKLSCMSEQ